MKNSSEVRVGLIYIEKINRTKSDSRVSIQTVYDMAKKIPVGPKPNHIWRRIPEGNNSLSRLLLQTWWFYVTEVNLIMLFYLFPFPVTEYSN